MPALQTGIVFGFGSIRVCSYYLSNPGRLGIIQFHEHTSAAIQVCDPFYLAAGVGGAPGRPTISDLAE
jgi:hypothetical protein